MVHLKMISLKKINDFSWCSVEFKNDLKKQLGTSLKKKTWTCRPHKMCDEIHRSTWATQEPGWLMTSLRLLPRIYALGKFLSTNQHFTSFMEWHVMELPNCFRKMCFWFGDCGFRMLSVVPEAEFIPAIPCLRSWSRQVYVRKWYRVSQIFNGFNRD